MFSVTAKNCIPNYEYMFCQMFPWKERMILNEDVVMCSRTSTDNKTQVQAGLPLATAAALNINILMLYLQLLCFVVFILRIFGQALQLDTFLNLKPFFNFPDEHACLQPLILLNNGKQQGTDRLMLYPLQQMRPKHLDPNTLKGHVGIKETFCLSNEFTPNLKIFIKFLAIVKSSFREQ